MASNATAAGRQENRRMKIAVRAKSHSIFGMTSSVSAYKWPESKSARCNMQQALFCFLNPLNRKKPRLIGNQHTGL